MSTDRWCEKGLAFGGGTSNGRTGRGMDGDPELDVTLSNGRESATFQIAPVGGAGEAWAILEPFGSVTVVMGRAAALEARSRLDRVIAERLAAGWVPVDVGPAG